MSTPNEVLASLHESHIKAESWQTGGNCGAIGVTVNDNRYILITPYEGPYSYGNEDEDYGDEWLVCLYDDETGVWWDSDLVEDGTCMILGESVPNGVMRLLLGNDHL